MAYAVLVADGHAGVRAALAARLGREPAVARVLQAATLEEALAAVERQAPRVVLCDPRTLGDPPEAVRRLAATGARVVALVASLEADAEEALRRAGARTILRKGIATETLLGHLARVAACE